MITVFANDTDSGVNAEIVYSIDGNEAVQICQTFVVTCNNMFQLLIHLKLIPMEKLQQRSLLTMKQQHST